MDYDIHGIVRKELLARDISLIATRFLRPSHVRASPELCARCNKIDFEAVFRLSLPPITAPNESEGIPIMDLGDSPLQLNYKCPLCRLIALSENYRRVLVSHAHEMPLHINQRWHLRAFDASIIISWKLRREENWKFGTIIALCPSEPDWLGKQPLRGSVHMNNFLLPVSRNSLGPEDARMLHGRAVQPQLLDFDTVSQLIDDCVNLHGCPRFDSQSKPQPYFKLIDCHSQEIVSLPRMKRYVTLSYLWGDDRPSEEESRWIAAAKSLPSSVPQTIKDAMVAVKRLGLRYLWVDRYCIEQFHSLQKAAQIASMADYYEQAELTIVALGENARSGLPGISRARIEPTLFECSGRLYGFSGMPLQYHLDRSRWSTRAWVYQEAILSSRCLFFTEEQIFFVCPQGTVSEIVPSIAPAWLRSRDLWGQNRLNPPMLGRADHSLLQSLLTEYRSRQLSMQSDSLNAFRGILSRLEYRSWWGIPFGPRDVKERYRWQKGLIFGLTWSQSQSPGYHKRRVGFPSWSWACTGSQSVQLGLPHRPIPHRPEGWKLHCFADISTIGQEMPSVLSFSSFVDQNITSSLLLSEKRKRIRITGYTAHLYISRACLDDFMREGASKIPISTVNRGRDELIIRDTGRIHILSSLAPITSPVTTRSGSN